MSREKRKRREWRREKEDVFYCSLKEKLRYRLIDGRKRERRRRERGVNSSLINESVVKTRGISEPLSSSHYLSRWEKLPMTLTRPYIQCIALIYFPSSSRSYDSLSLQINSWNKGGNCCRKINICTTVGEQNVSLPQRRNVERVVGSSVVLTLFFAGSRFIQPDESASLSLSLSSFHSVPLICLHVDEVNTSGRYRARRTPGRLLKFLSTKPYPTHIHLLILINNHSRQVRIPLSFSLRRGCA